MEKIRSLKDYRNSLDRIFPDRGTEKKRYAFRGHANDGWQLISSASRRLQKALNKSRPLSRTDEDFEMENLTIAYHNERIGAARRLFEKTKERDFSQDSLPILSHLQLTVPVDVELRPKPPLNIMSYLQHRGIATGLMDFSFDEHIALWFACHDSQEEGQRVSRRADGEVFVLDLSDAERFHEVSKEDMKDKGVQDLLASHRRKELRLGDKSLFWEPGEDDVRAMAQKSVFVLAHPPISDKYAKETHIVCGDSKRRILSELEAIGHTYEDIFPDIYGFAKINAADSDYDISKARG